MILFRGEESILTEVLSNFSKQINGSWDGEELLADNANGKFNLISYSYFKNCYLTVAEINSKDGVFFKVNNNDSENRVLLRIFQEGVSTKVDGYDQTSQNEILLYNNQQNLEFTINKNTKVRWLTLSIPASSFDLMASEKDFELKKLFNNPEPWFTHFNITPDIENALRTIFDVSDNKTLRRSIFLSRVIEILGILRVKLDEVKYGVSSNKKQGEIEKIINLKNRLLSNYSVSPNIKELCESMAMSETSLQRAFKEVFHMPILQFFNQNRLDEAHRQIKYSSRTITEISIDLGFSHIHHLSSAFKKQFGYSPKSLRQ
ncbi:helix-turn-helix domain-containing protein [Saccharicrinis aurantiacus]|uniref:helix-turn-helix domain-containing protein n=1 Tax=Saccharicrinis aurantiacus TaxID=1849719 RepID=UPI002490665F|nr:AraC family transcriptional regulator [Saccharicrinis aurantiacus]